MNQASTIFGAIYRRKHIVLLVMAGSIGVGLYENAVNPPDYMVAAEILIPEHGLGISIDTESGNIPDEPLLPMQDEGRLIGVTSLLRSRAVVYRVAKNNPELDPQRLKSNIRGDVTKDGVVQYTGYGRTPEQATTVANGAVYAFAEVLEEMSMDGMRQNLETFKKNEPKAWDRVKEAADAISSYLTSLQSADLNADTQQWLADRAKVQEELFQLENQFQQNRAQRPIIEKTLKERPEYVTTRQDLKMQSGYSNALERIANLSSELAVARLTYKDKHPEILRIQTELELAQNQASQSAELILSSSTLTQDAQIAALTQKLVDMDIFEAGYGPQKEIFEKRKAELDDKLKEVPGYRERLATLQSAHSQATSMAERISERRKELEFHLEHGLSFSFIDPYALAVPERAKQVPTPLGIIMFTSFSGLLLGVFVALLSATFGRMRATRPY